MGGFPPILTKGIDGKCLVCKENYYVDATDGSCVEVSFDQKVENCVEYDSNTSCTRCQTGFFLDTNKNCAEFKNGVENCLQPLASNDKLCEQCLPGKLLSSDGSQCLDPPSEVCSSFKNAQCIECNDGFVLNPNNYLLTVSNYLTSNYGRQTLNQLLRGYVLKDLKYLDNIVCTNPTVSNCLQLKKFNECEVCKDGHFLNDDKDCVVNPEDQIQHCLLYKTNLECLLCKDNYYFVSNDPSICLEGKIVENCEEYSVNEDSCAKCFPDFYLDSDECKERVASKNMVTCAVFNVTKDECATCKDTFALTLAGCQPGIESCGEYEDVATSREFLVCKKCKNGFYYKADENKCVQPATFSEDFCVEYKFNEPVCSVCKDRYYFDSQNTKCKIHDNIDQNCAKSSLTSRNSCTECNQGFRAYQVQKLCKSVTVPIPKCLEYETETICKQCSLNYYGNNCTEIDASQNCQRVEVSNTNNCELCKEGYFTNTTPYNKKCVKPFDTQADQCETFVLENNKSEISCTQCKENSYPVLFDTNKIFACELKTNFGSDLPSNCDMAVYNSTDEEYVCVLCSAGKVLDGTSCLDDCSSSKVRRRMSLGQLESAVQIKIDTQNDCVDKTNYANCKLVVPRVDVTVDNMEYVCGECKATYSKVVDIKTISARLKTHNYSAEDGQFKIGLRNPEFTCEIVTEAKLSGTTSLNNCELYAKFTEATVDKYGCIKCAMGKTGKVVPGAATADYFVIDKCDVDITGCLASETDMRGITPPSLLTADTLFTPYENYLSCIQCQGSSSNIPFISFTFSSNKILLNKYKPGDLTAGDLTVTAGAEDETVFTENSVACRDYTNPTDFGLPSDTSITFIANCALGGFEVNQTTVADAIYCLACKKSYKPVMNGIKVTNCDSILKCTSSNQFNSCSNCETPFNETTGRCSTETFSDPNCLRIKGEDCVVCKSQYTVNADGICEKVAVHQCKTGKFELPGGFISGDVEFVISQASRLGVADKTFGCSECESGYMAIKSLALSNVCIQSDYLKLNTIPSSSAFIRNCLKYGYNFGTNRIICKVCKAGLMPNGTSTECLTSLPGCLQSAVGNDSACQTCDSGRTLIGENCVSNNIANCIEYSTNGVLLFCEKCDPGYYILDKNQCILGKVDNCNIFENNSEDECLECNSGYVIYKNIEGKTFCLSYKNFSCLEWTNSSSFSCDSCATGFYPAAKLDTDPSHFCIGGNYGIDNCSALDTTLLCTGCNTGYYLNSSRTSCIARQKQVEKCEKYSINSDQCETCENKYYLHSNGSCFKYPIGIQYCRDYSNISTCIQCDPNKYLQENICLNVTKFVDNCELYKADGECVKCVSTHFLADPASCVFIQAVDCKTIKSHIECITCNDGYGLSESNGVTSCVQVSLANCLKNTITTPYTCTFCEEGFYLSEGQCVRADPQIDACKYYTDNTHCSQCKEFFALSEDKTKCMSNFVISPQIDFNCKIYHEKQFTCASCPANQNFSLGTETVEPPARLLTQNSPRLLQTELYEIFKYKCQSCGGEGCLLCDPVDFSKCYICSSGFHMNAEGKCIDDNPDDGTTTGPEKSQAILRVMMMVLSFWLWFK